MQLCSDLLLAMGEVFREGEAEPDLGLNISVCWTCAGGYTLAPALCAQSKRLAGAVPFCSLALTFMPFKLYWQHSWPFLLMAAARPGETFGPCCFSPRRASLPKDIPGQFCRDAGTVGTVVRMCRAALLAACCSVCPSCRLNREDRG